jgi:hypothetical protein
MIRINLSNPDVVRQLGAQAVAAQRRALAKTGDAIFDILYAQADTHTKTGALIRSLEYNFNGRVYSIYHNLRTAPHALFVHWPTRAHVIRPRNRKALRFPVGGAFAFAKAVNHPGYRGDPYFVRLAPPERVKGIFDAFLTSEIRR